MQPSAELQVLPLASSHWPGIKRIYQQGIDGGLATFESAAPVCADFMAGKIDSLGLVAVDGATSVAGWIAAAPVSTRWAYRGVIEHSVYIDRAHSGRGLASALLAELIVRAQSQGYWMIQSAIFDANRASRALHLKLGFREVGFRERIAQATTGPFAGQWVNTVLYELRLAPLSASQPDGAGSGAP
ncbi:hypothetical protein AFL94_11570 [Arthrobacter sp. LS16]|nr:hypothetical protein AFL94_11570 [Arthrobacter sp. LS16]